MKNLEPGGFAAMWREDKDRIQIISVSGEVDLYSTPQLHELLRWAKAQMISDHPRVVVDLSDVKFMDTAGLEVLLEEWNASRQLDGRMCLVAREGPVSRLLELSGLSDLFDVYAELKSAVDSSALARA